LSVSGIERTKCQDETYRYAFVPPSTVKFAPVMWEASGPATKATNAATSSTCPYRLNAVLAIWGVAQSPAAGFKSVSSDRAECVQRDPSISDFSRQTLGEHLDGTFRRRLGNQPRRHHAFSDAGAYIDYPTAVLDMLEGLKSSDERAAQVDIDGAIQLLKRCVLEWLGNGLARIVDEHIKPPEPRDCFSIAAATAFASAASA
jgi:hypothetical protein